VFWNVGSLDPPQETANVPTETEELDDTSAAVREHVELEHVLFELGELLLQVHVYLRPLKKTYVFFIYMSTRNGHKVCRLTYIMADLCEVVLSRP